MTLRERRQKVETGVVKSKEANEGGGETAWQKEAGKKREKNQREKALKTGNLLSPK